MNATATRWFYYAIINEGSIKYRILDFDLSGQTVQLSKYKPFTDVTLSALFPPSMKNL